MAEYTAEFYEGIADDGVSSARVVVPIVLDLVGPARRVLDLGCGVGAWLSVFEELGAEEVLGVDGDYVPREQLRIAATSFEPFDLSTPFSPSGSFDVAVSLEVAEHLPETSAASFVRALTTAAPVVLFSAAIPGQGGTGHINEQWPDYWAALFARFDYSVIDVVRPAVWDRDDVSSCIAQNILLFVSNEVVSSSSALTAAVEQTRNAQLNLVHPRRYEMLANPKRVPVRRALTTLPLSVVGAVGRRLETRSESNGNSLH